MDKEVVYILYDGILLGDEKDETLSFATTWMELEGFMVGEISQRKTNII